MAEHDESVEPVDQAVEPDEPDEPAGPDEPDEPTETPKSEEGGEHAEPPEPEAGEEGAESPGPDGPERPPRAQDEGGEPRADDVLAQIRAIKVGDLLLTTVTTLTSVGYGKLEAGELDEARGAIDAIRALLPLLEGRIDDRLRRDFERALANLQVAYADAAARS